MYNGDYVVLECPIENNLKVNKINILKIHKLSCNVISLKPGLPTCKLLKF